MSKPNTVIYSARLQVVSDPKQHGEYGDNHTKGSTILSRE
jgi:hypothetical protein